MITNLKKLEKNLGFKLKKNMWCLAVDTATKSGIALIIIQNKNVNITKFTIKIPAISTKLENKNEKYEAHLKLFSKLLDQSIIEPMLIPHENEPLDSILILENSFLKMNVVTFGFLRALQGIIYEKLHSKFKKTILFFPITARKIVGFQSKLPKGSKGKDKKKEIMKWISNIVEEQITDDNEADALLLAFAGLKE